MNAIRISRGFFFCSAIAFGQYALMNGAHPHEGRLEGRRPWLILALLLLVYAGLLLPTIGHQGIASDEAVDLVIAHDYLSQSGAWFIGSHHHADQARIPMATAAAVYRVFGVYDIVTARMLSCIMGALTMLGIFVFGRRQLGHGVAYVAVAMLAISPYFLSLARLAFTEADMYLTCAVTWLLVGIAYWRERPTIRRTVVVALLLGIAISTKFTALALIPAVCLAALLLLKKRKDEVVVTKGIILWIVWTLLCLIGCWMYANADRAINATVQLRVIVYIIALLAWIAPMAWAFAQKNKTAPPLLLAGFIAVMALLTVFILPPEHLTNPELVDTLFSRADKDMGSGPSATFAGESIMLYILSVLFKSTPLIGAFLLLSLVAALWQWRRKELQLPLLLIMTYAAAMLVLPISQAFYIAALLPLLSLLAADQFMRLFHRHRKPAIALAACAFVAWGADVSRCYPDYGLNGYQWLGARPLFGRSSIGYRSVAQTTSDGVQQTIAWLNKHAEEGDTVVAYVRPWHIILLTANNPVYRIENGMLGATIEKPDYIVTHINQQIAQGWLNNDTPPADIFVYPYDPNALEANYDKVFSVMRAFDLEVAAVWRKR